MKRTATHPTRRAERDQIFLFAMGIAIVASFANGCDIVGRTQKQRAQLSEPVLAPAPPAPLKAASPLLPEEAREEPEPRPLPPLWNDDWLVPLEVPGFEDAEVALPRGAVTPRRVIVALHGYMDRPEWQCGAWTGISEARMFVLCPRGVALPKPLHDFSFKSPRETRAEIEAGLQALSARYAPYLSDDPVFLVGFSLGALRAAHLAADDPERFPRVALVEGGTRAWSQSFARKFQDGGGERILFVCTQTGCRYQVRRLETFTSSDNVLARGAYLGNFGHHMGSDVTSRIKEHFAWLVEPDPNG